MIDSAPARTPRAGVSVNALTLACAVFIATFGLAFAVRWPDLDRFVTIDESRWIQRGADFWTFMQKGSASDTFLIGHPGVTTMWVVGLGMGQERIDRMATRSGAQDVTRREGYLDALVSARRAFVVLGSIVIASFALLVWRLAGMVPGIMTGALLATDPFFAGHGQVAHLDATLTGFMGVAMLSAMVVGLRGGGLGYVGLSGLATGLALLTKAPSVFLLMAVPLMMAVGVIRTRFRSARAQGDLALRGLLWGVLALVVILLLWPAFRADPLGTLQKLAQFSSRVGGGEHDNFFMGKMTDDPGVMYYPVMLAFRIGLGTFGGLLCLVAFRRREGLMGVIAVSGLVMLGFMLMMNLGPKKFDRYLLPIVPFLVLWSALGWGAYAERARVGWRAGIVVLALALQVLPALSARPYYLSYFNPLLGGGAAAQRQVLVGWGEGLAPVAAYLNDLPIVIGAPTVASSYNRVLQAHLVGSALPIDRIAFADYLVPYVNTIQRGMEQEILAPYLELAQPELSVWHNGIEYARVYRGPHHPVSVPLGRMLGGHTVMEALIAPGALMVRPQDSIDVLLRWRASPAATGETVDVQLRGADGRVVVSAPRRLGEDGQGGNRGGASDQVADLHTLVTPRTLQPGAYSVVAVVGADETLLADIRVELSPPTR